MAFIKRIFLFLVTNVAIVVVLTTVVSVFGLDVAYLTPNGLNLQALAIFSLIIGMTASIISLFMSKISAKWIMKVQVIKDAQGGREVKLVQMVKHLADQAGVGMPEVGIYPSNEINAFATGWNRNNSLVAVSEGLLNAMNADELEGVLAHEMAHVKNGDMVTMVLLQGVINAFVIFTAKVAAYAVSRAMGRDADEVGGLVYYGISIVFEIFFGILASTIVLAFSRWREFGADYGGAQLSSKKKMIAALEFLQSHHQVDNRHKSFATMKMSGDRGFTKLFSSHPPLEKRIMALQAAPLH
jgi:heat shock protein HtpX